MSQTIQEKNKALVLDAFDTLFNKRDYAAAEKFWSPDYIQHSAHIEPGREGALGCDSRRSHEGGVKERTADVSATTSQLKLRSEESRK
jgi:predicted SnoaL-like aldol condensation-catalyzing enzyme